MEGADFQALAQYAIRTILFASMPMLLISLAVGLMVSIIQAVTQIQEATLSFVPKIIAVFISMLIFGPWVLNMLIDFTMSVYSNLNDFIR